MSDNFSGFEFERAVSELRYRSLFCFYKICRFVALSRGAIPDFCLQSDPNCYSKCLDDRSIVALVSNIIFTVFNESRNKSLELIQVFCPMIQVFETVSNSYRILSLGTKIYLPLEFYSWLEIFLVLFSGLEGSSLVVLQYLILS